MINEQFNCKGEIPNRSMLKFKTSSYKFGGQFDLEGQGQGRAANMTFLETVTL